jgi:hypothetical protein
VKRILFALFAAAAVGVAGCAKDSGGAEGASPKGGTGPRQNQNERDPGDAARTRDARNPSESPGPGTPPADVGGHGKKKNISEPY